MAVVLDVIQQGRDHPGAEFLIWPGPTCTPGSGGESVTCSATRSSRSSMWGSTSVPGLAAKPIVDIDLVVPDSSDEDTYLPRLVAAGYRLTVREPSWHEHRLFKGPDTNISLHVLSPGCPETVRHQVFRDWLRAHPQDRDRYAAAKRAIAAEAVDVRTYAEAKNEIIDNIYRRAFSARG